MFGQGGMSGGEGGQWETFSLVGRVVRERWGGAQHCRGV